LVPKVRIPIWQKVRTDDLSGTAKTKFVNSKPSWPPNPTPPMVIDDGGDQLPSSSRATIMPDPNRAEPMHPALNAVKMISPYDSLTWGFDHMTEIN
jgi:hypothetical protein